MRYQIFKKLKHNNAEMQRIPTDNPNYKFTARIGWGEVGEGWYTLVQINKLNEELRSFGYPEIVVNESTERRTIEDMKEREIIVESFNGLSKEEWEELNNIPLHERLVDKRTEYYYRIPAITHLEYFIAPNYYQEITDTESTEYSAAHYAEKRRKEYPSESDMIVALWESVVENRHESKEALQAKRVAVKAKYPKP